MKGRVGLRDVYHNHVKEASEKLRQEHPDWKPRQVLAEARKLPLAQSEETNQLCLKSKVWCSIVSMTGS